MDFSMRKIFCFVLFAALACGCGRKPTGEAAFAKGIAYYKEDKFDKAVPYFEEALTSMQTNALALNFLGVCRLKEGDAAAGLTNLQDAVKLDPNYVPGRYNLALAQLEQGQANDAVANLRQVAASSSAPADVQYQLGLAYLRVSAWVQAEESFKRHLQSNPNSADTLNCLGIATARKREFPVAKRYFEQAIAVDPKFATAYLNLASLEHHQLAQKKEALAHYEAYLALLPKSPPREDVRLAMLQLNQELATEAKQSARATEPPAKTNKPPEVANASRNRSRASAQTCRSATRDFPAETGGGRSSPTVCYCDGSFRKPSATDTAARQESAHTRGRQSPQTR